jgi:beta-aspartyl-dipeptidase (metallo-type)
LSRAKNLSGAEARVFVLIKEGDVHAPEPRGIRDILVVGRIIARIAERIDLPNDFPVQVISAKGKLVLPGFVDLHVHLLGGGGEGGFRTRTPEMILSAIARAGVTTVVGCLGTDDVSRRPETLLAKACQLEEEGVSTYVYTGSYQFPLQTITGSVRKDIALIPKVIGVGEIAISDHRSSQPTFEELARVSAEARVGGMLGGKAGLVHFHVGSGPRMLSPLFRLIRETEIPITQFLPTHVNSTPDLIEHAIDFARMGGNIDITVQGPNHYFPVTAIEALRMALEAGVSLGQITLSSDSNGSMPVFDEHGRVSGLAAADIGNLYAEWKDLLKQGFSVEDAVSLVSSNPARRAGIFQHKGSIQEGKDADLLVMRPDLELESVMAKGRLLVREGELVVKGTFEP